MEIIDTTRRNRKIVKLRKKGFSYSVLGRMFKLSKQRIHQIANQYCTPKLGLKLFFCKIKIRDNFTCQWQQLCNGKIHNSEKLLVHHLDFNNKNNNPKNLITLCKKCHLYFHSKNHINNIKREIESLKSNKAQEEYIEKHSKSLRNMKIIKELVCRKCGYKWFPRGPKLPKLCPNKNCRCRKWAIYRLPNKKINRRTK